MSVERVRVGEVLRLERRGVTVDPLAEYEEIGVRSFGRGIFHKEPVTGASLGNKRVFRIMPGDLVLSNVFAWEGATAVADRTEAGKIGSHRFMTYIPDPDRIDATWAAWFFVSEPGLELIRMASPGSAGRNKTLAIERFEALEIPLPPLDEQQRVAAELDAWSQRAHVLASAKDVNTQAALLSKIPVFIDHAIRLRSDELKRVAEVVEFISDTVHPGDNPLPATEFVGLQHVESHTGRQVGSAPIGAEKGRKFRFRPGDIVYGYLRPYLNKVWLADRHGLCSVDQYVLRPRTGFSPDLLAHTLRSATVLSAAIGLTHSLQLPRLRSGLLADIEIPIQSRPSKALLAKLDGIRDRTMAAAQLRGRQDAAIAALVPAALNEVFGGLR